MKNMLVIFVALLAGVLLAKYAGFTVFASTLLCALLLACYHMRCKCRAAGKVKTKVVGVTGTIASGKSLVGKLLAEVNVPVLDTDHIAHYVQEHDQEVRAALKERFGAEIFNGNGELDRKKLGKIVFDDRAALADLNAIVHPAVLRECRQRIAALAEAPLVAVLVPLLFEVGLQDQYDEIWVVTASDEVVKERLKARDGVSDEEALKRIKAQFSQEEKIRGADFVIDNSGSIENTRAQVMAILDAA